MKKNVVYLGLLLAFSLILSYIEIIIPFQVGIPGVKLGLANLAVVLCLYLFGSREAVLLTLVKAVLTGFLFGNLTMILYSLSGALCSVLVMIFLKRGNHFHLPAVSALGGVMHNIGQLLVAYIMIQTYGIVYYIPILLIAGLLTGLFVGSAAAFMMPYLTKILKRGSAL